MRNKMKWSSIAVILLLVFCLPVFAAEDKIAYVDIEEVFDNYQKTKDQDLVLQEQGEKKEKERNKLIESIAQLEDELALLSRDARDKKQEEIITKRRVLEDFDREARRELGKQRNEAAGEIFQDIEKVVKTYGKKKGYDIILNKRVLLFQNERLDVTLDILKALAKTYKKGKR